MNCLSLFLLACTSLIAAGDALIQGVLAIWREVRA